MTSKIITDSRQSKIYKENLFLIKLSVNQTDQPSCWGGSRLTSELFRVNSTSIFSGSAKAQCQIYSRRASDIPIKATKQFFRKTKSKFEINEEMNLNFSLLQFLIFSVADSQEMPKKYQRMCNIANCETCQNYLMNFVIKENDSKLLF